MPMDRRRLLATVLPIAAVPLLTSACGLGEPSQAGGVKNKLRLAGLLPGKAHDGSWSELGLKGLRAAHDLLGADITYQDRVDDIPKSLGTMQKWVDDGYNVVWTHGSQFTQVALKLAEKNPAVTVISEDDKHPDDIPPNLWVLDREFHVGFYPLGVLAARTTKTGKIGYVTGLSLTFTFAEVHAMEQAFRDLGLKDLELHTHWTGDFDDPVKGRAATEKMLEEGCDVIVSGLDQGTEGLLKAVRERPVGKAWGTGLYTDKHDLAPDHFLSACLTDFATPVVDILSRVRAGERSGYYPMGFESGLLIRRPNASDKVRGEVQSAIEKVMRGDIVVKEDLHKPDGAPPPIA
jgi:basic membrane protein A